MRIVVLSVLLLFHLSFVSSEAQNLKDQYRHSIFSDVALKIDTSIFSSNKNLYSFQKDKYLFFKSLSNQDVAEIILFPEEDSLIENVQLLPSLNFTVIDSLRHFYAQRNDEENYFKGKIKFTDLENTKQLTLLFRIKFTNRKATNYEVKLYPFSETFISHDNEPIELFYEEEKIIELPCSNVYNIKMDGEWEDNPDYEIKLSPSINALKLSIKPKSFGSKILSLRLKTIKPFIDSKNELSHDLPPLKIKFTVKPNRIDYINPEKFTVYFNQDFKASEEIQFDYSRNMGLRKTYRIEDQAENGGNLIAEIYTQSQVGNSNKVLCKLRTFALHKTGEGYLYVKDGDKTRFLTNFNIIEKPRVDEMSIMHDGEDWTNNLSMNPGEKLEVRIKGTGLQQSTFQFDGIENLIRDSTRLSDEVAFYIMKVPLNISKKKINVFMNKKSTQYSFLIKEFQTPADFDFVYINYSGTNIPLSNDVFNKPIFYEGNIQDINLIFDPSKIDNQHKLYGKQYIDFEVKLFNSKNDLLEVQSINNLVVCPNESSPRGSFYDLKDCKNQPISLNDFLVHKTYSLDAFTQIYITVKHSESKYGGDGQTRKIKLILKRKFNIDVEVSFPAGLLTYKFNNKKDPNKSLIDNFSGISIAFIAQFRFYEGNNVNKFKPWSFGAGFIAIDAFNFNQQNSNRDLGIVALGTLTPIQRSKLSFPLYLGGGYLVNQQKWFVLFGPGLRFSF